MARMLDETPRPVPIINAGSGPDQHPTQALLDMYTLHRSFADKGGMDGKTICMVGDLKRGRTVRSLARLLTLFRDVRIFFVSPPQYQIADDLRSFLQKSDISFEESTDFLGCISAADAIYMTRVQDEYDTAGESKKVDSSAFHLQVRHLSALRKDAVIMHPMPRREEIHFDVDQDPRAKYWRQERNGMWTRVALITWIMGVDHHIVLPKL
jgi:aspartate carbamoyltransferase catalytic subunit